MRRSLQGTEKCQDVERAAKRTEEHQYATTHHQMLRNLLRAIADLHPLVAQEQMTLASFAMKEILRRRGGCRL